MNEKQEGERLMRIGAFQLNVKARKRILRTCAALLAVLLAVFCLYHFLSDFQRGIETMLVTEDEVEYSALGEAVLFRDEVAVESALGGLTVPLVSSGMHVPKDFAIATVYQSGAEYREAYRLLSSCMDALNRASEETDTLADLSALRNEISVLSLRIAGQLEKGNAAAAQPLLARLQLLSCRVQALTDRNFSISELISEISEERDAIVALAGQNSETVCSSGSGYYYPDADSFHTLCAAEKIETLTVDELASIISTLKEGNSVPTGVGTMVYSSEWYIAVQIDLSAEELSAYTVGEIYPVDFLGDSGERVPMTLVRTEEGGGESKDMLILSTLRMPENFSFQRIQRVRIVTGKVSGYTVPKSAVRALGGRQGVYVLEGSEVVFCRIEILSEFDSRYIVKTTDPMPGGEYTENTYRYITLYDAMILSDRPLSHGQILS